VAYGVSRLAVFFVATVATWYARPLSVVDGLTGWDASWYLRIAREGYADSLANEGFGNRWGFFPALPGLIRFVNQATPFDWETSGVLVALIVGGLAVIAVYLAVREILGRRVALATATLICFLPNAYTLSMVYTEGLFLACAGFCLYFLSRRRWELAGLAALLGGTTRSAGVVLIACCAFEGVRAAFGDRSWRPLTAPLIAPLGLVGVMTLAWVRIGEPLAFVKAQDAWNNEFDWFRPFYRGATGVLTELASWVNAQSVVATSAVLVALLGVGVMMRTGGIPAIWWIYSIGILVVAISPVWLSPVPRYLLPAFPLAAVVINRLPETARTPLISASGVMMGALALGTFTSIVNWQSAPLFP